MSLGARAMVVLGALTGCGRIGFAELPDAMTVADGDAAEVPEPSCPDGGCVVTHAWSKRFGSPEVDFGFDLVHSATARQLFLTGFYASGGADFGGGVIPSAGFHDAMVAVYDEDGPYVTARGYGGPGFEEALGIRLAANGDIYLVGRGRDMARFGGPVLTGDVARSDVFAARFTPSGGHLWSALHGGAGTDVATDVVVDDTGASYLSGTFGQTMTFGGPVRTAAGMDDAFVASYSAAGAYRWDRVWGSATDDLAGTVAFDPVTNSVLAAGRFMSTIDFGTGPRTSAGMSDGFLVALDATTGATRWVLTWGAAGTDGCNGITLDAAGNVYLAAYFSDTIQLGTETLTSAGTQDLALFSVTPAGTVRWATSHGGPGNDRGIKVAIGPYGQVITGGKFEQTATIGGELFTEQGGSDAFVMATTGSGGRLWARAFGSPGIDEVQGVAVDDRGRVYATGAFSSTITFGGPTLTSAGSLDTFLFRLDPEIVVPAP